MSLIREHALLEQIFDEHREHARGDEAGYAGLRAHAYRLLNFSLHLAGPGPDHEDKLAIAAGFHDIDAFSALDYLGPSIGTMTTWLERTDRAEWRSELATICAHHHRPTRYTGPFAALTEPFRRADWCEVLQGVATFGVPRPLVREAVAAFPRGVFFTKTVPLATVRWIVRHPLDPVPVMRGRRALRENGL